MLDALRRHASGWLAKILIALLVFSFAVWGIGDVFTGGAARSVATVGSTGIAPEEFQKAYQNQMAAIARQSGERLTPEQAQIFGIDQRVLTQLVNSTALANHATRLELALSDTAIVEGVTRDPDFHGPDGKFSKEEFLDVLYRVGLTEQAFIALRRKDELREQLLGGVTSGVTIPPATLDLLHGHREELRSIEYFTIDAAKSITVPEPDEAKLKETYEQNKGQFMTPAYRKVSLLLLQEPQVRERITIADDEVKVSYDATRETYNEPERRRIQQISFKDAAAAEAARKAIEGGKVFTDVAKEQGASLTDIELGFLPKSKVIDPKVAEAAFALERDKVSGVVEGRFAPVLLRVTEIDPGKQRTFDEVKDQVRDRLAKEKAKAEIQKLHETVEDQRGAGKTFAEIANELKLRAVEIEAVDSTNKTPDGKKALDIADAEASVAMTAAFKAEIGIEAEAVELPDGGYVWVQPISVIPPAAKPFETIREEVKTLYLDNERRRLLTELSNKLVERAKNGEPLDTLAKEAGGKTTTTEPVTRSTIPQGVSEAAVKQAFGLAKGEAGSAASADNKSRAVFRVADVLPAPAPSKEQTDKLSAELRQQLQGDSIAAYVEALKSRQGVSINEALVRRTTGAEQQQ